MTEALFVPTSQCIVWNDETITILRQRLGEGWSAGKVARELTAMFPGVTRNAVIGKASRLGVVLAYRQAPGRPRPVPQRRRASPLREIPPAPSMGRSARWRPKKVSSTWTDRDALAPKSVWISIWDLRAGICHWPKGDPRDIETFRYCGAQSPGRTYCSHHHAIAYVPARVNG